MPPETAREPKTGCRTWIWIRAAAACDAARAIGQVIQIKNKAIHPLLAVAAHEFFG